MDSDTGMLEGAATAQQEAYRFIRREIFSGAIRPGARLNLAAIAGALEISRMPVRDALRQLDTEGLVTLKPNRGARVVSLSPAEVEELYLIRAALEPLAVRLAVPQVTDDDLDRLALMKDQLDRSRDRRALWLERHRAFHDTINGLSRRQHLTRQIARVSDLLAPYLAVHIMDREINEIPGHEHDAVLQAIRSRDPERAETVMKDHIMMSLRQILDLFHPGI